LDRETSNTEASESDLERLQLALSTTPMFVWEWELATGKIFPLFDTFGLRDVLYREEHKPFQRVHPEDLQRVQDAVARIVAGEVTEAVDFRLVLSPGQQRWCSFRARRRCGADGEPTHLCGVTLDLTEQVLAAKAAAERANRAKDEFLAVLSHELRTPLAPARTLIQMLEHDATLAPEHRAVAAEISMHIGSEVRLIDDLLDFERLVHGKVDLHLTPVDVHEQARQALGISAALISRKRLVLQESLTATHPVIRGDVIRLRQVMWNLIQNAVKFTPHDGQIWVRSSNPQPDVLVVEVEDNGLGIHPEMLEKIFDEFERGGRGPDAQGGLGLGLAISRRIVEAHGGSLTAASPGRGGGAVFKLRLPALADEVAAAAEPPEAEVPPAAEPSGADRLLEILIVEDHRPTAKALARLLRSHGHTVEAVNSLAAAERAVAARRFDLLLCDIQLPEGSGLDLLPRVRHHLRRWAAGGAEAPAIVLSGFAREQDIARTLAAGFVAHLAKPVDQALLFAAIRRATASESENVVGAPT
jgi:two-component system CheB/CheR fusion protein